MPTLTPPPPELDEGFALFRDQERSIPTVRRESSPPVEYCRLPFRKYIPLPLPEPEIERIALAEWRQRFETVGIRVDQAPFPTPAGPLWNAHLALEPGKRRFAVSLDGGSWTEAGTLRRDRPFEELAGRVDQLLRGIIALPETDKPPAPAPPPAAPVEPPEVLFVRECVRRGIELGEPTGNGMIHGRYRGHWVCVYPAGRSLQVGTRCKGGGREYRHYPLSESLRLIDAELGPPAGTPPRARGVLFAMEAP